jgi:hypothetical protein
MDGIPTAEERAGALVVVGREESGGGFYIILRSPGGRPVYLGPYDNRDVAKLEATRVRGFVAAVIRAASDARPEDRVIGEAVTWNESETVIPYCELRRQSQQKW